MGSGRSADRRELLQAVERRVRAVLGVDTVVVLACPDRAGRLRAISRASEGVVSSSERSRWRRETFRGGKSRMVDLGDGRGLALTPLMVRGRAAGVLQVEAPRGRLVRRWAALELVADHLAMQMAIEGEGSAGQLDMGVAWTAHEIRGPLLAIRSALETLLERLRDGRDQALLRSSIAELERLAATSLALLELAAHPSSGGGVSTNVIPIVEEAATAVRSETGEDRIVLRGPGSATARAIPIQLHTAIVNLLRNAVTYSDPGTKVEAVVEADEDSVVLSVTNEGVGIPTREQQTIFGPFVRGNRRNGTAEGRGLGLFIAQRAVEAQEGRLRVDSERNGVTFRLMLPRGERGLQRFGS
jgi:signal transduction histidine kinase